MSLLRSTSITTSTQYFTYYSILPETYKPAKWKRSQLLTSEIMYKRRKAQQAIDFMSECYCQTRLVTRSYILVATRQLLE